MTWMSDEGRGILDERSEIRDERRSLSMREERKR